MLKPFISVFKEEFESFLKFKRSIGYKYLSEETILHDFDKTIMDFGITEKIVSKEIVMAFTELKPHQTTKTHLIKVTVLREFAKYLRSLDIDAYIYPNTYKMKKHSEYVPHIYTENELKRFFKVADNLGFRMQQPYRHLVVPAVFRLLFCCGLRLNEALQLKVSDVDFETGIIKVSNGKLSKDRLVPMSADLIIYFNQYLQKMNFKENKFEFLFPKRDCKPYTKTLSWTFRQILEKADIPHQGMLDILEDYIDALAKYNLNSGLVMANSMFVVDDEKQRSKMTEEFYINYKRDIDMYSQKIQNFIDNGCDSKAVIERWINKVKSLQAKKAIYENVLKRQLDDLDNDFALLKMQSNELAVRKNDNQMKIAA